MLIYSCHLGWLFIYTEYSIDEDSEKANGHKEMDAGTAYSIGQATILSKKRKALVGTGEEAESDGEGDNKAPSRDIYRSRQQKRVR